MSDREDTREDDRILRSARRPIAHLALGPEGDRYLFRQRRERLQQQRRVRAVEASRALVSEAAASEAMATSAQQTTEASSSGSVGSTVAQTQSQSAGIMASQPLVLTTEKVAIQRAAAREAQLQQALGEIKVEKERMIRRRVRMQRREADVSELEGMNPAEMDDDVRTIRSVLLSVVKMQNHQTDILQDIQQSLAVLVGRMQASPSPSGPGMFVVRTLDVIVFDYMHILCNAPGTFQHAMNRIFHDYLDKFVIVYLDDILIFSKTVEEHVAHLDKVLSLLRQHKFKINGEKCEFGRTRVLYLGHEISVEGLKPDDAKVASIRDWPSPQSVIEMRSFLGMTSYYRNFMKNYSIVAAPLIDLTRIDTPCEWTERCETAFRHLKHELTHYEVVKLSDPDKPCIVCQRDKPRTQAPLGLLKPLPIPERPGESLSMDFMDTLVTRKSGMRYIYVIVDRFSKFARLVAMPVTTKTEYVIKMFKENWVRDFGLPKSIVSDRDVRFTSELWRAAAAEQGTQLQMTLGNHPEANGQAEQMNRVAQHLLRHYIKPNQEEVMPKDQLLMDCTFKGWKPRRLRGGVEMLIPTKNEWRGTTCDYVGFQVAPDLLYLWIERIWNPIREEEGWDDIVEGKVESVGTIVLSEKGWHLFCTTLAAGHDPMWLMVNAEARTRKEGERFANEVWDEVAASRPFFCADVVSLEKVSGSAYTRIEYRAEFSGLATISRSNGLFGYRPRHLKFYWSWAPMREEGVTVDVCLSYSKSEGQARLRINVYGGKEQEMREDAKIQGVVTEARSRAERRCRRDGVTATFRVTVTYHEEETSTSTTEREQQELDRDSEAESEASEDLTQSWHGLEQWRREHPPAESLKEEIFGPRGERANWNSPGGMQRAVIILNDLEIAAVEAEPVADIVWDQPPGRGAQLNCIIESDGRDRVNATTRLGTAGRRVICDTMMEEVAGSTAVQAEPEIAEPEKVYEKPREEEPMDKVTTTKEKFRYQIPILTTSEIDDTLSKLLGIMVSVSFQTMLQASPRLLKGLRQLLTRQRVEVDENPESQEEEKEEETPQEVANLQRIPGDLEDLEKVFADIRLSLLDREGGEVMRAPPGTKLSFHALPIGKLKVQIGTHHTNALVDGGAKITLIRRDFATCTGCVVNMEVI
ncbi:hypothetical protein CBR_g40613 [Chara braunii]|uniref:Integrase catalytic domain-containing protein n=1 Tax=Chara braunii TaxID=69332 RepID=A0A388LTZ9_CHABU|nr:hypothetical protein CBR_g40613 [Chara braunii]|eukprot:GBG85804.1 hypothetical protein CBR_g40613 [Chara braunii]